MSPQQAPIFLSEIERLCEKYGVWVDVGLKKKPKLDSIKIEINAKVEEKHVTSRA